MACCLGAASPPVSGARVGDCSVAARNCSCMARRPVRRGDTAARGEPLRQLHAQRVDIAGGPRALWPAARGWRSPRHQPGRRRGVTSSAEGRGGGRHVGPQRRDAEIEQLGVPSRDQDVVRLDVAMDDQMLVRYDAGADRAPEVEPLIDGEAPRRKRSIGTSTNSITEMGCPSLVAPSAGADVGIEGRQGRALARNARSRAIRPIRTTLIATCRSNAASARSAVHRAHAAA